MSNRLPRAQYIKLKKRVAERFNYCCALTGRPANDIHHIIPRAQGGRDEYDNLVPLSREAHILAHGVNAKAIRAQLQEIIKQKKMSEE
jgi:5-methylcytosine-specific restriction endonuclease McrA